MSEIIIDGVDVSECKNFIPIYTEDTDVEINNCCTLTYTHCHKYHENCYFKQLQRLKAENEQLKKEVETWKYQTEKRTEIGDVWFEISQKYKTALEDIREIFCNGKTFYDGCFELENFSNADKAIKLINEVLK